MDEDAMIDAEPTRSHGVSRSAADIKAELDFVARLISGLPTNVEPGEYEAALETHLTSRFTALQLELEHTLEASGTSHHPASCRRPVARSRCDLLHSFHFQLPSQVLIPPRARQLPSLRSLPRNSAPTPSRAHPMLML